MAIVRGAAPELATVTALAESSRRSRGRALRRYAPISIGIIMALAMGVLAAGAPLISPLSPSAPFADAVLKGPGAVERHFLGTDEFGRDLPSRIIWGRPVRVMGPPLVPDRPLCIGCCGDPLHRDGYPHGGGAVVSRAGDPTADPELGEHPQRGPPVHQVLPLDHDLLRALDHARRTGVQPGGRRPS